jgi:predicted NAD/FAD-dependent oxidoreductase
MDNDEQAVIEYLCGELKRVTGFDSSQASCRSLQRWRYANMGAQPNQDGFIDFDENLAACGDWCIQGRVESAFLVGQRVAAKILSA